jgi:hypothetical protein
MTDRDPDAHALWAKYDGIGNRLRDIAKELGVIYGRLLA